MVILEVVTILFGQFQTGAYTALLKEKSGYRKIPVTIGTAAAHFITVLLGGLKPPRPMIYDLFFSLVQNLNIELQQVNIYKYKDGIFYSELIFNKKGVEQTLLRIDACTSDSIVLALRFKAPIFTTERIITQTSVLLLEDEEEKIEGNSSIESFIGEGEVPISFESMSIDDLQNKLKESIEEENYERAACLRDVILMRQKNSLLHL